MAEQFQLFSPLESRPGRPGRDKKESGGGWVEAKMTPSVTQPARGHQGPAGPLWARSPITRRHSANPSHLWGRTLPSGAGTHWLLRML